MIVKDYFLWTAKSCRILLPPWLSLWESCRRRRLRGPCRHIQRVPSPSSLRSDTSPKGRGKEYTGKEIFDAYLPVFAGKIQENRSGFLGRFKGVRGEIRNPPGLVFFLPLFLLEKQKEKWDRTRKFAEEAQPSASFPQAKRISPISYPAAVSAAAVSASVVTSHVPSSRSVGS